MYNSSNSPSLLITLSMGESTPPTKLSAATVCMCPARGPKKTAAADGVGRRLDDGPVSSPALSLQPASEDAAIRPRTSVLRSAGVGALEPISTSDDGGSEENGRDSGAENDSAT